VGLPIALTPLWQLTQLFNGANAGCGLALVAQDVVLKWQVSHCAVVAIWVTGFICAFCERYEPLWHVEHLPFNPVWFIVTNVNET
jgi:hypothetical protein